MIELALKFVVAVVVAGCFASAYSVATQGVIDAAVANPEIAVRR